MKFEISLRWEAEEGVDVDMIVTGSVSPRIPATWTEPAEGGEIEDVRVFNERGTELPQAIVDRLLKSRLFVEAVENKIAEQDHGRIMAEEMHNEERREQSHA